MENSEIIWTGSPDDMTAISGEYVLRAEELDDDFWWWCTYFQDECLDYGYLNRINRAKTACEKAYYEHLKTR